MNSRQAQIVTDAIGTLAELRARYATAPTHEERRDLADEIAEARNALYIALQADEVAS